MSKLIEKDQGVIDSLLPEGHKDNHPFLRVLYNTNGYYEYWNDWAKIINLKYIFIFYFKPELFLRHLSFGYHEHFDEISIA